MNIFLCSICHLYVLVREVSAELLLRFFFYNILFVSLLSIKSSLYILDTSPVSDICFTNIFSKSLFHLFYFLLTLSSEKQTFLVFRKSNLLLFIDYAFWIWFRKSLFYNFIVLGITFTPMAHLELIFVYGMWYIHFVYGYPIIQETFIKMTILSCVWQKSGFILDHLSIFTIMPCCIDTCSFIISL